MCRDDLTCEILAVSHDFASKIAQMISSGIGAGADVKDLKIEYLKIVESIVELTARLFPIAS